MKRRAKHLLDLCGSEYPRADYGANVTRYIVQDGVWTPGTQVTGDTRITSSSSET